MKREHSISDFNETDIQELRRRAAMHEAGHAAAIYLGNRQRMLPPAFFQILISPSDRCMMEIEGGRLIQNLPFFLEKATRLISLEQQQLYRSAFEADIVSLLAGSLTEVTYVAKRDNELINPHLVPLGVLHKYGGEADLATVQEYLDCFVSKAEQQEKLKALFWQAFEFINDWTHWYAITELANYIMQYESDVMNYGNVVHVLDTHFTLAQKYMRRTKML